MSAILRKLSRDLPAMLGLAIVLFVLAIALFGPLIAPYPEDAAAAHLTRRLRPPSLQGNFFSSTVSLLLVTGKPFHGRT